MKRRVALLVIVVLTLACTEDTGSKGDATAQEITDPSRGATSTQTTAFADAETLDEFFGLDNLASGAPWDDADSEVRRQELVRMCMAQQGFDYIPFQYPEGGFTVVVDEEEFTRTLGFGVTTQFSSDDEVQPLTEWADPNEKLTEAMSDQERQAYFDARYGTVREQQEGTSVWGAGCEGDASEQIWGEESPERVFHELWEELGPQIEVMWERISADQRIIAAQEGWSVCMAQAGYAFGDQDEMHQWVRDDLAARFIIVVGNAGGDPFEGWTDSEIDGFFAGMTNDEIDEFWAELEQARDGIDLDALSALQQEEIDLAVANFECSEDVNEVLAELSREYEARFVASNRGILERIRDTGGG